MVSIVLIADSTFL